MKRPLVQVWISTLVLAGSTLLGHDFWIQPSSFRPSLQTSLSVQLKVGDHFRGDTFRRASSHIQRFLVSGPAGTENIRGVEGMDPAGIFSVAKPGLHVIAYQSTPQFIELEAEKFESYLAEEGLDEVIRLRSSRGESQKRARESYSRCARSLIWAGGKALAPDQALGLPLELIAETNPYSLGAGEKLSFRLLFQGEPVENALISALLKDREVRVTSRSDGEGRAQLLLSQPGVWMIKSVHMVPASSGAQADWESYWASLTFELR